LKIVQLFLIQRGFESFKLDPLDFSWASAQCRQYLRNALLHQSDIGSDIDCPEGNSAVSLDMKLKIVKTKHIRQCAELAVSVFSSNDVENLKSNPNYTSFQHEIRDMCDMYIRS
jgi:hypothetical protein